MPSDMLKVPAVPGAPAPAPGAPAVGAPAPGAPAENAFRLSDKIR